MKHPYKKQHKCEVCKNIFIAKMWNAKYCLDCKNTFSSHSFYSYLPSSTIGTIGELLVSIDLLKKGYEVFRAISSACSCDLAVLKNRKLLRIEVRSGKVFNNKLIYPKKIKVDIMAVIVHSTNKITYIPDITKEN